MSPNCREPCRKDPNGATDNERRAKTNDPLPVAATRIRMRRQMQIFRSTSSTISFGEIWGSLWADVGGGRGEPLSTPKSGADAT